MSQDRESRRGGVVMFPAGPHAVGAEYAQRLRRRKRTAAALLVVSILLPAMASSDALPPPVSGPVSPPTGPEALAALAVAVESGLVFSPSPGTGAAGPGAKASAPAFFTENVGQITNRDLLLYGSSGDLSIGFSESSMLLVLRARDPSSTSSSPPTTHGPGKAALAAEPAIAQRGAAIRVAFEGSNAVLPQGRGLMGHPTNFFIGSDPTRWHRGVASYSEVVYENLYDGIDLVYRATSGGPKYELHVGAGLDPSPIELKLDGADSIELGSDGALKVETTAGVLVDSAPVAYQGETARRCIFELRGEDSYGFACDEWDTTQPLVIDPLVYAAYLGGSGDDFGWRVHVDGNGSAFSMGGSSSVDDFPTTPGAFSENLSGQEYDVALTKLTPSGDDLVYSTYFGGTGDDEIRMNLDVANDGALYVVGTTTSNDFPTTPGAFDRTFGGGRFDAYMARFNETGGLDASTYIGGNGNDWLNDVAVDEQGNVVAVGDSVSTDLPVTGGAFRSCNETDNLVIVQMVANLSQRLYWTCLGEATEAWSMALGPGGLVYFAGDCWSEDGPTPTTANALYPSFIGAGAEWQTDGYFGIVSIPNNSLVYASFLGTSNDDSVWGMGLDANGSLYMGGSTNGSDFPIRGDALDSSFGGGAKEGIYVSFGGDVFVVKVAPLGGLDNWGIEWSTFVGGNGGDVLSVDAFDVDARGNTYLGFLTYSTDFPATANATDTHFDPPAEPMLVKLNAAGSRVTYATYLRNDEYRDDLAVGPGGISVDRWGDVYVAHASFAAPLPGAPPSLNLSGLGNTLAILKFRLAAPENLMGGWTGGELNLNWLAPIDADRKPIVAYRLYRGYAPGNETFDREIGNITAAEIKYLGPRELYCFQVSAFTATGESERSEELCTKKGEAPSAPTNVTAAGGAGIVSLIGEPPGDDGGFPITSYVVFRNLMNGTYVQVATLNGSLNWTDVGLTNGLTYCYQVYASNAKYNGTASAAVCATPAGVPGPPSDLSVTVNASLPHLEWRAPAYTGDIPLVGYVVYRNATNGSLEFWAAVESTTQFNDSNVTNGTLYVYSVSALNALWEGQRSANVSARPMGVPGPPTEFEATGLDRAVQLNWSAPSDKGGVDLLGYFLYRGSSLNSLSVFRVLPGNSTGFRDVEVENGRTYFYALVAYNEMWNGTQSDVKAATPLPTAAVESFPWTPFLLLIAVSLAAAGGYAWWRRARGSRDDGSIGGAGSGGGSVGAGQSAARSPTEAPLALAPANVALAAATPSVVAPVAIARPGERAQSYLVENVFLLYRDGRPLFTSGALGVDAVEDPELVGTMLVAVQDFIRDSFKGGASVDRMGYGDGSVLIERGEHVILAVTVFGSPGKEFRELMAETLSTVEGTYAGVIEQWDGNKTALRGLESLLAPLWVQTLDLTHEDVLMATTAREVQVRSGVEFFQGFVRLKVSVVNSTTSVITGASIDLDYDHDALRLHKIEPATYRSEGTKVNLAVINTGEKKTIAYYFDPQICTSSSIDGACRFKDPDGSVHTVQMKSRKAEVVCPLFFTQEQANTAMLKRLVKEELGLYDVKGYSFKGGTTEEDLHGLFEAVKATVRAHDVVLVRSFERKEPYTGEAWFYGRTQKRGDQIVIRGLVDSAKARVEFYAASGAIRSVTGLLAEFHHTFDAKVKEEFADLRVEPLFDESLRRGYSDPAVVSELVEGPSEGQSPGA